MSKTALLVIDAQRAVIEYSYEPEQTISHIVQLIEKAHQAEIPVLYVQHDGPEGSPMANGQPMWQLHSALSPRTDEPIVAKQHCDAFLNTTLQEELQRRGITHLVVVGGMTEQCIDTSVRRATSLGYTLTLVSDAHTTADTELLTAKQIIDWHNFNLARLFYVETSEGWQPAVSVIPTNDVQF
jgi:nicotinamidase-related amidase